jgi:geranylgeranyl transferase type-2 subunit beta
MTATPYLERLASRLARSLARLPRSFRDREIRHLHASQKTSGGFAGPRGAADLYYTSFALRAAAMLNLADDGFWERSAAFLRTAAPPPADPADVLSLLVAAGLLAARGIVLWSESHADSRLADCHAVLDRFRASPAGFAKTPGGAPSLYHAFLAALSNELLGESVSAPDETRRLVLSRRSPAGGFADTLETETPGTNPTAAGVGLLRILDALDPGAAERAAAFLLAQQRPDGGFAAHPAAPVSDLLSTFTALVALADAGAIRRARLADVGRFVQRLALPSGGFAPVLADDSSDVEYTFYGLGSLALLASELPD